MRPAWIESLSHAYSKRGKGIVLLTGGTLDVFQNVSGDSYLPLEQSLFEALKEKFVVVRFDVATGISFYDDGDREKLLAVCAQHDRVAKEGQRLGDVKQELEKTAHVPLAAMVLLASITTAVARMRLTVKEVRPVCVLVQYAGALLPNRDWDALAEVDRQRLVQFLSWVQNPVYLRGDNLVILVAGMRSELNQKIISLPSTEAIEIDLPNCEQRKQFAAWFQSKNDGVRFEGTVEAFAEFSAGLSLTSIQDILEVSARSATPVSNKEVLAEVNLKLEAELGGVVKVIRPSHTADDVIGYEAPKKFLRQLFKRCNDPKRAVSSILVSGPNGSGKTFLLEALAQESGRIVIELAGLRGMYFGETDKLFERLLWHIRTYGKILILVDEAHTAFGSVHSSDTHETEKRLAGNIIKMMGNKALLGKVLWALMTSRPDRLDPDVKSRSPIQIPLFDLNTDERRAYLKEVFGRNQIELKDDELNSVVEQTSYYSLRDYGFLLAEVLGSDDRNVLATLKVWQASKSIMNMREQQSLIAAQHCSYPELIPKGIREEAEQMRAEAVLYGG